MTQQNVNLSNNGWTCPVCGAGNAPWMSRCPCVPYPTTTTVTIGGTGTGIPYTGDTFGGTSCPNCGQYPNLIGHRCSK